MDKEMLIIDLLKDVRTKQDKTTEDISEIKIDVALNKEDLKEHMAQTRAVKELVLEVRKEADERIESINKKLTVGHLLKLIVTTAAGIGTITTAIYGLTRIFSS